MESGDPGRQGHPDEGHGGHGSTAAPASRERFTRLDPSATILKAGAVRKNFRIIGQANIPPTNPVFDQSLKVNENRRLSSSHFLLTLESDPIAAHARPGQFLMLRLAASLDPLLRRPMSVCNVVPEEPGIGARVQVLYKVVGRGTSLLANLSAGDSLPTLGPLGTPFSVSSPESPPPRALIVAGGIGIAPFPFLVPTLKRSGWNVTLLYGVRRAEELVHRDWFEAQGVEVLTATEDGSEGRKGTVTPLLEEALSAVGGFGVAYACGPNAMLKAVSARVNAAGVPCQLSLEGHMGCGIGACLGCAVPVSRGADPMYVRVCLEGPTLSAAEVLWD